MNKLSLILTTYNNEENLPKTLESIEMQDYPFIEVVIKDGGSKDNTMDIIKKYAGESKYEVKYTSSSDTGIYDAMNQGYALSTGQVIAFFNDRFLVNDAVTKMMRAIYPDGKNIYNEAYLSEPQNSENKKDEAQNSEAQNSKAQNRKGLNSEELNSEEQNSKEQNSKEQNIEEYNSQVLNGASQNNVIKKGKRSSRASIGNIVGAHADLVYANGDEVVRYWHMGPQKSIYLGWLPGHPTMYLKREIYEKYGLYNTGYRISADYEFMVRFLKDKENKLAYVPETLISMYYGGTSNSTFGSYMTSLIEGNKALRTNGIHPAFLVDCFRTLRVLLQFVRKS